jgi:hypothetical protein
VGLLFLVLWYFMLILMGAFLFMVVRQCKINRQYVKDRRLLSEQQRQHLEETQRVLKDCQTFVDMIKKTEK